MTVAFAPPMGEKPRPRRRGLFDGLLMFVLIYAVYAKTPLGAIGETAVNMARGQKDRPSWLATFKGRETSVKLEGAVADATKAEGELPAAIKLAAETHKVDPEAVASLIALHGQCNPTVCDMATPPRASSLWPAVAGKPRMTADDVAKALAEGKKQLGPEMELGVEAMWIGPVAVKLAVEQADRSHLADPADAEAHAEFLAPSTRRGPLQAALAVIAVYRMRTLAWPASTSFRITSPYGERIHPVTGLKSFHNGTDLGVPTGTPLVAAHKGSVKRSSRDSVSGNYVILQHGLGIETVYCHLSESGVAEGNRVRRKDTIGLSGATGRVTGPHLHYIVRVHEKSVDPEKYGESPTRSGAIETPLPPPVEEKKPPPPPPKKDKKKKAADIVDAGPPPASPEPASDVKPEAPVPPGPTPSTPIEP
jgi:murein DD-endopeptidase